MSSTVWGQPATVRQRPFIANPGRLLKLAAAFAAVATSAYAMWLQEGFVASDNAVVSAYVVALRTPIDGNVTERQTAVGQEVAQGAVLATVTNPLMNDQHLQDLRDQLHGLGLQHAAFLRERDALRATLADLQKRVETYRQALVARLSGQLTAARMSLVADLAQLAQARSDYARQTELARTGVASQATLDRSRASFDQLEATTEAQAGQLASTQAQLDAATLGVTTDQGANDVAYSAQRSDEIRVRLADLERELDSKAAEQEVTRAQLDSEQKRIALLHSAKMTAPSAGMLWKVGATKGERLGTGDMAAELVDCRSAFLLATIPQSAYSHIMLGGVARFRLSSETQDRTGEVLSVTGDTSLIGDRNLAAVPANQRESSAIVRVAVPASQNTAAQCLVGRSARVLLPMAGDNMLQAAMRLMHRFF